MGNCAGIDWASEKHDVLIEDPGGEELLAARFVHDEDGVSALCAALACFEVDVVAIERPDGCWWVGCWRRACGCWRCTPTRSRRRGIGFACREANRIGLTGSCYVSWHGPTATASGSWS